MNSIFDLTWVRKKNTHPDTNQQEIENWLRFQRPITVFFTSLFKKAVAHFLMAFFVFLEPLEHAFSIPHDAP